MFQTLRSMLAPAAQPNGTQLRTRLVVDELEARLVPAWAGVQSGVLIVVGNASSDNISVSDDYSNNYTVSVNGYQVGAVAKSSVWQNTVRIFGNAGNDYINKRDWVNLRMEVYGGSGNDDIWGGSKNDTLRGESGNDTIHGGDGHDYIDGGDGDDRLFGQGGSDTLVGWNGNDTLYGNDYLSGDGWRDYLYGGFGSDQLIVGNEADSVFDSGGNNSVYKRGQWTRL